MPRPRTNDRTNVAIPPLPAPRNIPLMPRRSGGRVGVCIDPSSLIVEMDPLPASIDAGLGEYVLPLEKHDIPLVYFRGVRTLVCSPVHTMPGSGSRRTDVGMRT